MLKLWHSDLCRHDLIRKCRIFTLVDAGTNWMDDRIFKWTSRL